MAIIKCPECGHQVSDQAKTCPSCGVEIAGKVMRCSDCGEFIFKNQEVCPNCHRPLNSPTATPAASPYTPVAEPAASESAVVNNPGITHNQEKPAGVPPVSNTGTNQPDANAEKPKKKNRNIWILALVIALIVGFCGMYFIQRTDKNNEEQAYENAMQSSDAGVLQNYLDLYKDAPQEHIDSIQSHLDKLKAFDQEWMNAVTSNSKSALEDYIRLHPDSPHKTEALVRIDSLDWGNAQSINTPDAYQQYMTDHADGSHFDEAKSQFDKLNAQTVTDEDKQMVKEVFHTYFNAISQKDESSLISTLGDVLGSFLHTANVTPSQVVNHMHKLYEAADITGMNFKFNNDWKIDKKETSDGEFVYNVTFSVIQSINRSDTSKGHLYKCLVNAKVSSDGKISDLDMRKQQVE